MKKKQNNMYTHKKYWNI